MQGCINQATTMTTDLETDLRAYAEAGFESVELWLAKLEAYLADGGSLDRAQDLLRRLGLRTVAACAQGGCLLSSGAERRRILDQLRHRLMLTRALGADTLVVFSESPEEASLSAYETAAANLAQVADLAAQQEVSIALEFIKGSRLVGSLPTAQELVRRADRANLGVLFDTFHFYAGISKMADLEDMDASLLALVHVNDVGNLPRESWTDRDRVLPGQGVLPLVEMLGLIQSKGYEGYCSIEVFSRDLWEDDPFTVARLAHDSLTQLLAGLSPR